jgi:nitrogen-specific signal transduction histidine kinase
MGGEMASAIRGGLHARPVIPLVPDPPREGEKVGCETSSTLAFANENLMKETSCRGTLPAKSSAVCGPVTAGSDRIAHHEPLDRSTEDGLDPELEKAGNRLEHRLIAILAHELRNPLASIMLALHVLRERHTDGPMDRHACDAAERQARHMAQIIEQVLDLCRAGQDKLPLCKERVDLAAVVAGAVETAGAFLATRGHHLTVSLPPGPVSLVADPSRLNQILTNLLTNAAKYTDPGGEICLAAEVAAGGVVLQVRDNGMGIAPDLLPRVFDLFQQGAKPADQACGGLGIGLALVKSLVELHSGTVSAFSGGPGTGSQFVVRLLDCAPNAEKGRAVSRPENGASLAATGRDQYRVFRSMTAREADRANECESRRLAVQRLPDPVCTDK